MKRQEREKFLKIVDEFEKRYEKDIVEYLFALLDDEDDLDIVLEAIHEGVDDDGIINICINIYDERHPENIEDEDLSNEEN